jgi:hypothetical protein
MKWFDRSKVRLMLLGFVAAIVLVDSRSNADFTFGDVEPLPEPINTPGIISGDFTMTADGLEAYFVSISRPGGYGREDIWVCRRQSPEDDWCPAVNLGPNVNTSACESQPCISADGIELYLSDVSPWGTPARPGGHGGGDIWVTRRANRDEQWAVPVNLGAPVNTGGMETYPNISADGLSLYFSDGDLWLATRPTRDDNWSVRARVTGGVNSGSWEGFPNISADQRVLLFYSDRPGGYGGMDIYMVMRPTVSDAWGPAVNLGPMINTPYYDMSPSLSADGYTLHFTHNDTNGWSGNYKICRTTISPVVDFNGDGIVDAADMCIMVENWGTDNSLCDVGLMPWGDGVVDIQDLVVLAQHLFEGAGLAAHWALDEIQGDIAYDSTGHIDATVFGGQWAAGKIDGALQFNGFYTYVDCGDSTRLGTRKMTLAMWLNPEHMGGMRYILARANTDSEAIDYAFMRHLEGEVEFTVAQAGSDPVSIMSNATTPLNEWTHVAVSLDGSQTTIYINGRPDASAGYAERVPREGFRLVISSLNASTRFYNGKIDDVRIYNVTLAADEIETLAH